MLSEEGSRACPELLGVRVRRVNPFENLRRKNERGDDQRREEFPDGERGDKCDRHGKLHRHAALKNVLERFPEDGIPADQRGHQTDDAHAGERLPKAKPDGYCSQRHKDNAEHLQKFKAVFAPSWEVFGSASAASGG